MAADEFYVYVHRRADTRALFYVGKGKGRRAWVRQHRTRYWRHIVEKTLDEANAKRWHFDNCKERV